MFLSDIEIQSNFTGYSIHTPNFSDNWSVMRHVIELICGENNYEKYSFLIIHMLDWTKFDNDYNKIYGAVLNIRPGFTGYTPYLCNDETLYSLYKNDTFTTNYFPLIELKKKLDEID